MKIKRFLMIAMMGFVIFSVANTNVWASTEKKKAGKDPYDINKILKQLMGKKVQKVSGNQMVSLDVILKPQNSNELNSQIYAVNTPGNPQFKKFYTPMMFQSKFGYSNSVLDQFKSFFKKYHLKTFNYKNVVIVNVVGKAKYINKAFATDLMTATYHNNPVQFSKKKPVLSKSLGIKY